MKIYNQNKTQELQNPDLKLGKLVPDTIIYNYPEVKEVKEQGHYITIAEYPNGGKDVQWIVDVPGVKYQPARSEVEDIYIYIPYTSDELKEIELNKLRFKREPLLRAFDAYKINVLYGIEKTTTLSEQTTKQLIDDWYTKLLDLNEDAIDNPPERIKYYL